MPEAYQCYIGTPFAAYNAGLRSIKNLEHEGLAGLDSIPTLIFIDPQDELVSEIGIWKMLQKANLKNWEIVEVNKKGFPHHLIIDELSVGKEQWHIIAQKMLNHLLGLPDYLSPKESDFSDM